eukprot:TRINITY_DN4094_c0_g2_i1.p1 TRINITY_DN4094_c0_g2~~TRINITY_DN4094_c0_g2_i1.p1  ORF type:complete len:1481 (+),score=248.00 TRINITY_DN4094_c0_g2_i1:94-4536(+)
MQICREIAISIFLFEVVLALPGPPQNVNMHFWDTRCNSLKYRSWSYLAEDMNSLQSIQFPESGLYGWEEGSSRVLNKEIIRTSEMVAAEFGAAWFLTSNATFLNKKQLWLASVDSYADQFLTSHDLVMKYGFPWYEFKAFELWSFYKQPVDEVVRPFLLNLESPADLSADSSKIIFTHVDSDSYLIRSVSLFDVNRKARISLNAGSDVPDKSTVVIISPHVVQDWAVYTEFDTVTGSSRVWIEDFSIGARELVVHPDLQSFWGMAWNATSPLVEDGEGAAAAAFATFSLTALNELELRANGDTYRLFPVEGSSVIHLTVVLLPSFYRCEIPFEDWSSVGGITNNVSLIDYIGGGGFLFLSVSFSDPISGPQYGIVAYPIAKCTGNEGEKSFLVPNAVSGTPIKLVSASYDGLLFATSNMLFTAKITAKGAFGDYKALVCRTFDSSDFSTVGSVSILNDHLVYQQKDLNAESLYLHTLSQGGTSEVLLALQSKINLMYRADLDKDNDRHWDAVDRFPLRSNFFNDSDNDGIGDQGDILANENDCSRELATRPGDCWDDIRILYITWGVVTFCIILCVGSIGYYNKKSREKLYIKKKATADEWINRQWRETTRHDVTEEELFTLMADLDDRIQTDQGMVKSGETVVQAFLFLLTIASVVLWIASMWSLNGFSLAEEHALAWVDFYTSTIFLIDLTYRWIFRDEGEYTGFKDYCIKNWYDFPSLISDVPGVTTAGPLNILVVARLIRLLRVFKMFRVVRLYHKLTQQQAILGLILRYDTIWQAVFVCGLILSLGVVIKLFEQQEDEEFEPYANVLWFCIVTVTTIGYGDMVPENPVSRILAVFLMVSGIGIIGVLTASMGDSVRYSGVDKGMMMERVKKMQQGKWRLALEYLRNSVLYNPIFGVIKPFARGKCAHPSCSRPLITSVINCVKISYGYYKYHQGCFRCHGCGRSPWDGGGVNNTGECWVVTDSSQSPRHRGQRGSLGGKHSRKGDEEVIEFRCKANIYLHRSCLLRDRGGKDELAATTRSESSKHSHHSRGSGIGYGGSGDVVVEELLVKGFAGSASQFNGTYIRRPATDDDSPVLFDHKKSNAVVTTGDTRKHWILVNRSGTQETCYATANSLLGDWTSTNAKYGSPLVDDGCAQHHSWWRMYDVLDISPRNLIQHYASHRTKAQFLALINSLEESAEAPGGKFSSGGAKKRTDYSTSIEKVRTQIKAVADLEERRVLLRAPCLLQDRLLLILRTHKLQENGKVKNFELLKDHLEYLVYHKCGKRHQGTMLAKVFSIRAALELSADLTQQKSKFASNSDTASQAPSGVSDWGEWQDSDIDWSDPVEWTLHEIDRCLVDHDVDKLESYPSIKTELEHLVLTYDRVLMSSWAWDNLTWDRWHERAERPLRLQSKLAEMPIIPVGREEYCEAETMLLDPLTEELEKHQIECSRNVVDMLGGNTATDRIQRSVTLFQRSLGGSNGHAKPGHFVFGSSI